MLQCHFNYKEEWSVYHSQHYKHIYQGNDASLKMLFTVRSLFTIPSMTFFSYLTAVGVADSCAMGPPVPCKCHEPLDGLNQS